MSVKTRARMSGMGFYPQAQETTLLQVGAGGIGSWFAFLAMSSGIKDIYLFDDDTVEVHNIGGQFYNTTNCGKHKTICLKQSIKAYSAEDINTFETRWNGMYNPIMVSCVDNMKTRKEMFDLWKSKENRELFLDGRLGPENYEVYFIRKGDEATYEENLFDDADVPDLACSMKQTKYMAFGIASKMMENLCNYLTNKKLGIDAYRVPIIEKHFSNIKRTEYVYR